MNAKEARTIRDAVLEKKIKTVETRHINHLISKLLKKIEFQAREGSSSMLFSVEGALFQSDIDKVKRELISLGYSFSEESDNGLKYEMINW